jgi:hemerythrin
LFGNFSFRTTSAEKQQNAEHFARLAREPLVLREPTGFLNKSIIQKRGADMDYGQLIEWDDRYSTGIELIDEQHQELISQLNNLFLGCQKDGQAAKIFFNTHIRLLLRYMNYHFSSEEKMLKHIKYPDLDAHSRQHSVWAKIITEKVEHIEQEDLSVLLAGNKLLEFIIYIRDMFIHHITILDKKYVSYIHFINRKIGTYGMAPAEYYLNR